MRWIRITFITSIIAFIILGNSFGGACALSLCFMSGLIVNSKSLQALVGAN